MSGRSCSGSKYNLENSIRLENLKVHFPTEGEPVRAVDEVSVELQHNEVTAIIGETGCGKSVLGMALLRLLPSEAIVTGSVMLGEKDIYGLRGRALRSYRNKVLALIPQNPSTSMNPVQRVGRQVINADIASGKDGAGSKRGTRLKMQSIFDRLGLADGPECRVEKKFPFQLSGGMQERALISIGIIRDPLWLLADEPTKGLDAALRSTVAELLGRTIARRGGGVILITHDIDLANFMARRVLVMYGGHIVEDGPAAEVLHDPSHPYTKNLIRALPRNGFQSIPGPPIAIGDLPGGCRFHPRCPEVMDGCDRTIPPMFGTDANRKIRCFLYADC